MIASLISKTNPFSPLITQRLKSLPFASQAIKNQALSTTTKPFSGSTQSNWQTPAKIIGTAIAALTGIAYERLTKEEPSKHSPLQTDFYQFTMGNVNFLEGREKDRATFYLHFRNPLVEGCSYNLLSGLESAIEFIQEFHFSDNDIKFLAGLKDAKGNPRFSKEYLTHLKGMKLDVNVYAAPEGSVTGSAGPALLIEGPVEQCHLLESVLLNILSPSCMISTKASRFRDILGPDVKILNFDFRRQTTDPDSIYPTRSSWIGGVDATANTYAASKLNLSPVGTMAHSFITTHQDPDLSLPESELVAFETYLKLQPGNAILLVDTYGNVQQGIERAIQASINTQIPLMGVRIDSGNLYELTWYAKERLDQAKINHPDLFSKTGIVLTDGINEAKLIEWNHKSLNEKGKPLPITHVGIGTNFVANAAKGNVYKASAIGDQVVAKIGEKLLGSKTSLPGRSLDTLRLYKDEKLVGEMVVDKSEFDLESFKKTKMAVSYKNESLEQVPDFDDARFLLVPVFTSRPIITELEGYSAQLMEKTNFLSKRLFGQTIFANIPGRSNLVYTPPSLEAIRAYAQKEKSRLPDSVKAPESAKIPQFVSQQIYEHLQQMQKEIKKA